MAQDITEQASQEELADSLVSEPEESQPQQETDTGNEEIQETEPAETEEQVEEETADDWLPDEQEKVFPDEVLAKYAQRYNVDLSKADPQLRQLIHDKINTDIYARQLQQERENQQVLERQQPEPVRQEPTQPQQAPITREQYFQTLQQAVQQRTDPVVANEFYSQFMKAFGVDDQTIAAQAPQQAQQFTQVMSTYALNLINTFADDLISARLNQHMESAFPQFGEMYQTTSAARSWDGIRNELQAVDLPQYGTNEYSTAAREIGASIAGSPERFEAMVFTGQDGKPLSASENLAEKQRIIAERMLNGGGQQPQIPPALMAQAVKTGQRVAQRQATQKQAGNLSAGKSKAQVANNSDDDFWAEGIELYNKNHSGM